MVHETKEREGKVYKLKKALYGLKQSPRAWNKRIDNFLLQQHFVKCTNDHGIYSKGSNSDDYLIVCLYVDDMLLTGTNEAEMELFKKSMMLEFEMSDLGLLGYFLGIEFNTTSEGTLLHQRKYAGDVLKRFDMWNCNAAATPSDTAVKLIPEGDEKSVDPTLYKQLVGSLRYLCHTRPDLAYSVGIISRYMEKPLTSHLLAAKRILRYIKGTMDLGVWYPRQELNRSLEVYGFTDADWCGDKGDRKSTAAYVFMFGKAPIAWSSKKESVVALSSCEAEYIAAAMAACQAQWLDMLLNELRIRKSTAVRLMIDSKSAIDLAKYPVAHGRSKHIETKFHFLRDQVSKMKLKLEHCPTELNIADLLTKALKIKRFEELRDSIGIRRLTSI